MATNDIRIKDATPLDVLSGDVKMPVSDGSMLAKSMSISQTKSFVNDGQSTEKYLSDSITSHNEDNTSHKALIKALVSAVQTHNTDDEVHADIRDSIEELSVGERPTKEIDSLTDINNFFEGYSDLDTLKSAIENTAADHYYYGIERDSTSGSTKCTRIGNMDLHRSLPIQSRMAGCILDDNGNVVKYLNSDDWTGETRDGSIGQVMVEIPEHYRKFETEGNIHRVKLSTIPLNGFHFVPRCYVSAYEASLDRTNLKLSSVVNATTQYRGGNNNDSWDDTYRSLLGRPVTNLTRSIYRTYARNRNTSSTEWNIYTYDVHKTIYWLYVVEYANLNSQDTYTSQLTTDGFRQGGLGIGVTGWGETDIANFNSYNPFIPCGYTDSLGNNTGIVDYTATNDDSTISYTNQVPRYRGIENPFGHIHKWLDGISVIISPSEENGGNGLSKVYICNYPQLFSESKINDYIYIGDIPRINGYISSIMFGEYGEIIPLAVGGSSSTYFCDYQYTTIPTSKEEMRGCMVGGCMYYKLDAGLISERTQFIGYNTDPVFGTRLTFIPKIK